MVARRALIANGGELEDFGVADDSMEFGPAGRRHLSVADDSDSYPSIVYMPDGGTQILSPANIGAFNWSSTVTSNIPGGGGIGNDTAPNFVVWTGEVILLEQGNLFNTQSLFNQSTTITCQGANSGPIYTMINQPLLRTGSLGGSRIVAQQNAVRSQIRVGPNVAGSILVTSHEAFFATAIVDATVGTAGITDVRYFAPKAPSFTAGGFITTLHLADFPNIPAAGITNLRGVFSLMSSGEFIRHEGTAPVQLGGALQLGVGTTFDWSISRLAANVATLADGDSLRIPASLFMTPNGSVAIIGGASGTGDLRINTTHLGFGIAPAAANWAFAFTASARTITVGGDFANALNTAGGNHTIDAALSTFTQWTVNAPAGTIGSGSVVDAANMIVQTAPSIGTNRYGVLITANPSGGTENWALRVPNGEARFDRPIQLGSFTVAGVPSAAPAGRFIYVSDETGGAVPAFSDGTDWRRVTDRAIIA